MTPKQIVVRGPPGATRKQVSQMALTALERGDVAAEPYPCAAIACRSRCRQQRVAEPNAAAAVQETLGRGLGDLSTLINETGQTLIYRGRDKLRPYYDLIVNIAKEELGHIELVAATVNLILTGTTKPGEPESAPLSPAVNLRNTHHFGTAQTTLVGNSMREFCYSDDVFSNGNLVLDLLHNLFLKYLIFQMRCTLT